MRQAFDRYGTDEWVTHSVGLAYTATGRLGFVDAHWRVASVQTLLIYGANKSRDVTGDPRPAPGLPSPRTLDTLVKPFKTHFKIDSDVTEM